MHYLPVSRDLSPAPSWSPTTQHRHVIQSPTASRFLSSSSRTTALRVLTHIPRWSAHAVVMRGIKIKNNIHRYSKFRYLLELLTAWWRLGLGRRPLFPSNLSCDWHLYLLQLYLKPTLPSRSLFNVFYGCPVHGIVWHTTFVTNAFCHIVFNKDLSIYGMVYVDLYSAFVAKVSLQFYICLNHVCVMLLLYCVDLSCCIFIFVYFCLFPDRLFLAK